MVSKRQKASAIVVVLIAVLVTVAGLVYLVNPVPKPSTAEKMIVRPSDLGTNWTEYRSDSRFPNYLGQTSETNYSLGYYDPHAGYIEFFISLWVFNTSDSARVALELQRTLWIDRANFTIEDEGFLFNITDGGIQGLTFIRENVMCEFYTSSAYPPYHSLNIWALDYAAPLQAEKIDQYLAG